MKLNDTLHKLLIGAGAVLAILGFVVSYAIDQPLVLMPSALAVAAAGYGYVKLQGRTERSETIEKKRLGIAA